MDKHFKNIFKNNPVLVRNLGLVSLLALSTDIKSALWIALTIFCVLLCSSIVASLLKRLFDEEYIFISSLIIMALFSSIAYMIISKLNPEISTLFGVFLPLISVNSFIYDRVKNYAFKNKLIDSILDAITNSLGYLVVIVLISFIRELIGKGSVFGHVILPQQYLISSFLDPAIGFIIIAIFMIIFRNFLNKSNAKGGE